jgi:hypothetical protein
MRKRQHGIHEYYQYFTTNMEYMKKDMENKNVLRKLDIKHSKCNDTQDQDMSNRDGIHEQQAYNS